MPGIGTLVSTVGRRSEKLSVSNAERTRYVPSDITHLFPWPNGPQAEELVNIRGYKVPDPQRGAACVYRREGMSSDQFHTCYLKLLTLWADQKIKDYLQNETSFKELNSRKSEKSLDTIFV